MQTSLQKLIRNPYTQTILAIIITILIIILLGNFLLQPDPNSKLQLISIIGIGITLFLFFTFSLWKVNQQKQWVSIWANHQIWVILTFFSLPLFLTLIFNLSAINTIIPKEMITMVGIYHFPHFMVFYFWEALVFGIAFLAHPERKNITWHFSLKQCLFSLLLSLGLWSAIMFLNEIQLQQVFIQFSYMESQTIFWPILPFAIIIIPISTSFIFFRDFHKRSGIKKALLLVLFLLIPLRTICILQAFFIFIVLGVLNQKKDMYSITVLTYAFLNLFTLILNWNWVI